MAVTEDPETSTPDNRVPDEPDNETALPWWRTLGTLLRSTLGALSLVGGLTWLLLNLHGPQVATDVLVGAVLTAGGLVLLMPHRIRLRPLENTGGAALAALLGTFGGLAAVSSQMGGMYAYVAARGYPFQWLRRGAVADDPETARSLAEAARWQIDVTALTANLVFWAYVGLLAVVAVELVRRVLRARAR
jgi:hypothetical protein